MIFDNKNHMRRWSKGGHASSYLNKVSVIRKGLIWTTTPVLSTEWNDWLDENPQGIKYYGFDPITRELAKFSKDYIVPLKGKSVRIYRKGDDMIFDTKNHIIHIFNISLTDILDVIGAFSNKIIFTTTPVLSTEWNDWLDENPQDIKYYAFDPITRKLAKFKRNFSVRLKTKNDKIYYAGDDMIFDKQKHMILLLNCPSPKMYVNVVGNFRHGLIWTTTPELSKEWNDWLDKNPQGIKYYAFDPITQELAKFLEDFSPSKKMTYYAGDDMIFDEVAHVKIFINNFGYTHYINTVGKFRKGLIWTTTPELSEEWRSYLDINPQDAKYYAFSPITRELVKFNTDFSVPLINNTIKHYNKGSNVIFDRKEHAKMWNNGGVINNFLDKIGAFSKGLIWSTAQVLSEEWQMYLDENPQKIEKIKKIYQKYAHLYEI